MRGVLKSATGPPPEPGLPWLSIQMLGWTPYIPKPIRLLRCGTLCEMQPPGAGAPRSHAA